MEAGNLSNVKSVGSGLLEYRIDYGPGYRIYFGRDGERLIILLAGGTKKRQQADIATALVRWCAGANTSRERAVKMVLTRDFKETIKARAADDVGFRAALLSDAVELLLSGDVETGKAVLRDFINATIGFERLAELVGTPPKSLMRMFGPKGNPRADNLFGVISRLQEETGLHLVVAAA